jgi:two-component system chemotaxis sensor kinase CheA
MEDRELIHEFLIESGENLARLDQEMVELEKRPEDRELLSSVFRTIHTIKGTCGFLGFGILEEVTHHAENLLSKVRNGECALTPPLASLVLEAVDAVKAEMASIERAGQESGEPYTELIARLSRAVESPDAVAESVATPPPSPVRPASPPAPEPARVEPEAATRTDAEPSARPLAPVAEQTIRVDVGLLDNLMNLVGELVLARNQILQFIAKRPEEDTGLNGTSQRLNLITTQLQEGVMKTRMQPIGLVWNKLPRVVRDLAHQCGKQIRVEMIGAETELDKSIIESIKDPLTHIVRNSCDHGIEMPEARVARGKPPMGTLTLRAFHEGGQVNIEIADDGAGIDPEKVKAKAIAKGLLRPDQAERLTEREAVNLVFLPGFSTAEKVTNISGRGVGMDVVRTNIERMGGVVDLVSQPGMGAAVRIKIPLTLAIIPGLVVEGAGERFVIPQASLLELIRLEGESKKRIETVGNAPVFRRRGRLLPLLSLAEAVGEAGGWREREAVHIVVLQAEKHLFGLVVDGIFDTQEIVVKPLGKQLMDLNLYAGATIMGDGRVVLILDILGLARMAGLMHDTAAGSRRELEASDEQVLEARQSFLLVSAGARERVAVPLEGVARIEEIPRARMERAGGRTVTQYRGRILPLTDLTEVIGGGPLASRDHTPGAVIQAVVLTRGGAEAGVMVDQVLDVIEESARIDPLSRSRGLAGSAVLGGKVTDILDLDGFIADGFRASAPAGDMANLLTGVGS